jgi:hypothetical protein
MSNNHETAAEIARVKALIQDVVELLPTAVLADWPTSGVIQLTSGASIWFRAGGYGNVGRIEFKAVAFTILGGKRMRLNDLRVGGINPKLITVSDTRTAKDIAARLLREVVPEADAVWEQLREAKAAWETRTRAKEQLRARFESRINAHPALGVGHWGPETASLTVDATAEQLEAILAIMGAP